MNSKLSVGGKVQGWSYLLVYKKIPQTWWLRTTIIFFICSQTCNLGGIQQGPTTTQSISCDSSNAGDDSREPESSEGSLMYTIGE